jgi:hypothetical protein
MRRHNPYRRAGHRHCTCEHSRDASTLSDKSANLKRSYTDVLENFQRSGQQEADVLPRSAMGNRVIMDLNSLVRTPAGSIIEFMAMRLLDEAAREDTGVDYLHNSSVTRGSTAAEQRKARKRPRSSVDSAQSKLHVRGLEGIGDGRRSRFQSQYLDTSEARKGHAENVLSILMAIKDVKSMLEELPTEGDASNELERQSYLDTKNDLHMQLTDPRGQERIRQLGYASDEDDE